MNRTIIFILIVSLSIVGAVAEAEEQLQLRGPDSADRLAIHSMDESQALISVLDADKKPIMGLQPKDFAITKGPRNGKILSVTPREETKEIPLNVVLVLDNSFSMKQRKAIQPMLAALDEFLGVVRPIDNINAVVFDDHETINLDGNNLNARTFQSSNVEELRSFFNESFMNKITWRTYLYEGMLLGLDIIRKMPEESTKFLVVFTDGEDINSTVSRESVQAMAKGISNFSAYALDFTEKTSVDFFLNTFTEAHKGRTWKVASSAELVPIFKSISDTLLHQYVVTYRFLNPPAGTLALVPETITIEEVTTIDTSPLLNYVFFEAGKSALPDQYVLFPNSLEAQNFSEDKLGSPMEKYRNILNIIGIRLTENPEARITITGCNSNRGQEKGNKALSESRAASVQTYLQQIWGVDPARMEAQARNLPKAPSSISSPEGIAENQRAEIYSNHPAILDIIRSTYVQEMANPKALRIVPQINAEAGIAHWKVELKGEDTLIESAAGSGDMTSAVTFNLVPAGLSKIASFKTLTASVEVTDKEGEAFKDAAAATTNVRVIRKEAMKAERKGYRVLEQYALILFEYDSAEIREHNKVIVDRIVARMKEMPSADVQIIGHTDITGAEQYNMDLSKRRAKAVYDQIVAAGMSARKNLSYTGVGPHNPLYDNAAPEGRALNRTVTITLEYEERG